MDCAWISNTSIQYTFQVAVIIAECIEVVKGEVVQLRYIMLSYTHLRYPILGYIQLKPIF